MKNPSPLPSGPARGEKQLDWLGALKLWLELIDLDPDSFWRRTPFEINIVLEAAHRRLGTAHNERMSLAWHTASLTQSAMTNPKKYPRLEKLLIREPSRGKREMTPDEQWRVMSAMASTAQH